MALRADLAGDAFLLPADLNLAMEVGSYRLRKDSLTSSSVDRIEFEAARGAFPYCEPRDSSITFAVWNMMRASSAGARFLM